MAKDEKVCIGNTNRNNSYDLLRLISCIAVISIHVSARWLSANTSSELLGTMDQEHLLSTCLWNVMARFAVPCFMMMSGALLLSDERNRDFSYFYKKQFRRIGVPTLVFIFLYFLYGSVKAFAVVLFKEKELSRLLQPVVAAIRGDGHLWYMYALAGVYILIPVLLRLKRDIGEKSFAVVTWVFLILASIGYITGKSWLMWDVGFSFRFVGYFMAGYEIRRVINKRKSNLYGMLLVLAGGVFCLSSPISDFVRSWQVSGRKRYPYRWCLLSVRG